MRPQPSNLDTVNATLPTPIGTIEFALSQANAKAKANANANANTNTNTNANANANTNANANVVLTLAVPPGTSAAVCLPPSHSHSTLHDMENDADTLTIDGQTVAAVLEGRLLCASNSVLPGTHVIERVAASQR